MLENGVINRLQLWLLVVNYVIGSAIIFIPSLVVGEAKQDGWISFLIVILVGPLFILLTVSLSKRNNYKSIVEISQTLLGRYLGIIIGGLYAWFYIHLAAIILREIGDMIFSTILVDTPLIMINILIAVVTYYIVFHGIEVLARSNEIFLPIVLSGIWITVILVIPLIKIEYLSPVLAQGIKPVLRGAFPVLGFTFAEMAIFFMILPFLNNHKNLSKILVSGGIVASLHLLVIIISTILVLGPLSTGLSIIPALNMARLINVADFLTRVEVIIILAYTITLFIKTSVTFYAGVLATAQLFNLSNYRPILIPLTIIIISLSMTLNRNIVEFLDYTKNAWTPYALLFGLVIPVFLLGLTLLKNKVKN